MLNDNLENYIKENLENARVEWDRNAMWDDIESRLPPKKKKRGGWYFLIAAFILISSVAGYFLLNDSHESQDVATAEIIEKRKSTLDIVEENVDRGITYADNTDIETDTELNALEKDISEINYTNTVREKAIVIDERKGYVSSKVTENNDVSINDKDVQTLDNYIQEKLDITIDGSKVKSQKPPFVIELKSLESISELDFSILNAPIREFKISKLIPIDINRNLTSDIGLKIGFFSGIGLSNRYLRTANTESLLRLREDSESTLEVLSSGIRINKLLDKGFFIGADIEYQRINEKLDYTETTNNTVTISSDSAYVAGVNSGSVQYYRGNVDATVTKSVRSIRYNAYHSINIPLYIGYNFNLIRGYSLSAYTGPVINAYQNFSGYNIDLDGRLVETEKINGSSLINAFDVGLSMDYGLTSKINLSLGASFRKGISAFMIDDYVSQSYDNMNLQVGILYNFF